MSVPAGELIPGDGDVIEGAASVDESAITGESAPVIRESGGDRSAVTGGTRVLSDHLVVRITQEPGESFLDRMIALVEGANRQKTPNELALNLLLVMLTFVFLVAVVTLQPMAIFSKDVDGRRARHRGADRGRRHRHRAGLAPGLSDPDDHRRAALRDRHRGHGPAGAAQRTGHVRAGGRGRGRRQHPAARQDRHDHLRQPAGERVPAGRRRLRRAAGEGRAAFQPRRRDARGPLDRRIRPRRAPVDASTVRGRRRVGAVHRHHPHVRGRPAGRSAAAQGRRGGGRGLGARAGRRGPGRAGRDRRPGLRVRRYAAGRGGARSDGTARGARRRPPQGRRQAGPARTLRRAAPHGHPHGDDHR